MLETPMTGAAAPAAGGAKSNWLGQAARMTAIETSMYLRDKVAIFWTFVYPIVLLVLLMAVFGGGSRFEAKVDVQGDGPLADRYLSILQSRFDAIDSSSFSYRRVSPSTSTPSDRVRVVLPSGVGTAAPSGVPIQIRLASEPDAESGSMLSIVSESTTQLNADLSGARQVVAARYDIGNGAADEAPETSGAPSSAAVYYVVGIGVLTMISIALFGFSGPLIELRARGGLNRFQFMPVFRTAFLAGFSMCRILILVVFVLTFLFFGLTIYAGLGAAFATDWLAMTVLIVAGSVAFLAAGLALAGLVTSNTLASAVINFVNLPIMFLSDLFIPIAVMPQTVQNLAQYSPVYLLVNAMRETSVGAYQLADSGSALIALAIMFAISVAVILTTFRWKLAR